MNTEELEILEHIYRKGYHSQREISKCTGYSLGKVNQSLRKLREEGYLTNDIRFTNHCKRLMEHNRSDNAIILAAGFGMRMTPLNQEVPKGLLEVRGEILIERIIEQLVRAGIHKITVVVGFLKESYEYLIDKYGVDLAVNMEYVSKNNLHSLSCVREQIENTYIIPCDIYCAENPFSSQEFYSWYMVTDEKKISSDVKLNKKRELIRIKKEECGNDMLGISYINQKDSMWIREKLQEYSQNPAYDDLFWEETLYRNGKMIVGARKVSARDFFEINTLEQLREADESSVSLKSDVLTLIADVFHAEEQDIRNIKILKKGMTNRSFQFEFNHSKYIMRIPGPGTEKLIDRKKEYEVYQAIKDTGICDDVYYINPENGYKITGYLDNAKVCDDHDWTMVEKCMSVLREFHNKNLKVHHTFDLYEHIEMYEKFWEGNSCFGDYEETKKSVLALKPFVEKQEKKWTLTHIDANADNFLIWKNENDREEIKLIDWEYAGMQDAHLDVAMFAIYSMYQREEVDRLIDCYFEGECPADTRLKIYSYIALGGLLWSNWCEYKRQQGQEFGEYSIRQYRYAKEYSRMVQKELKKREVCKSETEKKN